MESFGPGGFHSALQRNSQAWRLASLCRLRGTAFENDTIDAAAVVVGGNIDDPGIQLYDFAQDRQAEGTVFSEWTLGTGLDGRIGALLNMGTDDGVVRLEMPQSLSVYNECLL